MSCIRILVGAITLLSLAPRWADARVVKSLESLTTVNTNVQAHDISKYTTQYFLDTIRYNDLPCNTCLFYTFHLTATAQRYAQSSKCGLVTIWDIWPGDFYNGDTTDVNNPLRGIFSDTADTRTYYENMSSAMAQLCGGFATVMTKDPSNIPVEGIWGRSELPTLQRDGNQGGQIHTIVAIDAKGDSSRTSWIHPKPDEGNCEAKSSKMKTQTLAKRQPTKRYTPDQLQTWFASVPF